jgi:Fe-S-cluster containining protein
MTINDLYLKVSEFEKNISNETLSLSNCKNGCSRCCYVDLSVFQIEADNIRSWFHSLSSREKNTLQKKWQEPLSKMVNFHGEEVFSCPFLSNESCTIYEARPLICRTQGLALKFKDQQEEFVDICPLNEEMIENISTTEILNLDLLNLILSQLENIQSQGSGRERPRLETIKASLLSQI